MNNIIEAIEAKLQAQKDDIFFKDVQIKDLKERLEKAEAERDEIKSNLDWFIKKLEAEQARNAHDVKGVTE